MKKCIFVLLMFFSAVASADPVQVVTKVKSVMSLTDGTTIIFISSNAHTCLHPARVRVNPENIEFAKNALSIAMAAQVAGSNVRLFLKDNCQLWGQKEISAISLGEESFW